MRYIHKNPHAIYVNPVLINLLQHSFTEKRKRRKKEDLPEMLDYAVARYGKQFVQEVKALKNISYMFIPFPIFWALFDQQVWQYFFK